jgi:hypothetical protein
VAGGGPGEHVAAAGVAAEQHRPRALQDGVEREAVGAGRLPQPGHRLDEPRVENHVVAGLAVRPGGQRLARGERR